MPSQGCLNTNIPISIPIEAQPYVLARQTCSDVQHLSSGEPFISVEGYMLGHDCTPNSDAFKSNCAQCSGPLTDGTLVDDGVFVLRTYMGAVLRPKKALKCSCGNLLKWNPSEEYIHTIRNNCEGGKYV